MKKYFLLFIFITIILVSASCSEPDYHSIALNQTIKYIETLNDRDIEAQMKLLDAFKLDRDAYNNNFLQFVESAGIKSDDIKVVYEDKFIIIVEAKFDLVLSSDFLPNAKFKKGLNECTRYFTYKKQEDMKLVEILHKLIVRKEDSWIK